MGTEQFVSPFSIPDTAYPKLQVFRPIIISNTINVMNRFPTFQGALQFMLHDVPMFRLEILPHPDHGISTLCDVAIFFSSCTPRAFSIVSSAVTANARGSNPCRNPHFSNGLYPTDSTPHVYILTQTVSEANLYSTPEPRPEPMGVCFQCRAEGPLSLFRRVT